MIARLVGSPNELSLKECTVFNLCHYRDRSWQTMQCRITYHKRRGCQHWRHYYRLQTETKSPCRKSGPCESNAVSQLGYGLFYYGWIVAAFHNVDFRTAIFSMGPLKASVHDGIQSTVIRTPSHTFLPVSSNYRITAFPLRIFQNICVEPRFYFAQT